MQWKSIGVCVATAAALWMGGDSAAHACLGVCSDNNDHGRTIAGLACQIDSGDKNADWGYSDVGQICNYGYQDIWVHCPLLRTQVSSTRGLDCASATILHQGGNQDETQPPGCGLWQLKGHGSSGSEWKCILQSKDETGWWGWWIGGGGPDDQDDGPPSEGFVQFELIEKGPKIWAATWQAKLPFSAEASEEPNSGGSYYLSCHLPGPGSCGGETCLSSLKWWER